MVVKVVEKQRGTHEGARTSCRVVMGTPALPLACNELHQRYGDNNFQTLRYIYQRRGDDWSWLQCLATRCELDASGIDCIYGRREKQQKRSDFFSRFCSEATVLSLSLPLQWISPSFIIEPHKTERS